MSTLTLNSNLKYDKLKDNHIVIKGGAETKLSLWNKSYASERSSGVRLFMESMTSIYMWKESKGKEDPLVYPR